MTGFDEIPGQAGDDEVVGAGDDREASSPECAVSCDYSAGAAGSNIPDGLFSHLPVAALQTPSTVLPEKCARCSQQL